MSLQPHVRYRGQLVSITDVCCRPSTSRPSNEERATVHKVVFPRAGVFVRHLGHDKAVANPNHVLFFNANEPCRVSHPVPGGGDCTVYVFSTDTIVGALGHYEPAVRDHPEKPTAKRLREIAGMTRALRAPRTRNRLTL
jgi:hypothetical protein